MMREIKFRAWDGERLYTKVLAGNVSDPNSEDYTAHCIYRDGDWFHSDEHDSIVLEQYTGLKDKNGAEIYEGDIVKLNDDRVFRIEFVVNMGGWYLRAGGNGVQWHEQAVRKGRLPYEVIGNIHQNPDLVKAP